MNYKIFQIPDHTPSKNNRTMALQVQNRLPRFLLPSGDAASKVRPLRASLTLEAALVLPVFLFAMYLLILPMRMMDTSRKMLCICEAVCRNAAAGSYLLQREEISVGEKGDAAQTTAAAQDVQTVLREKAVGLLAATCAAEQLDDNFVEDIQFWRSRCMDDGEIITVTLDYRYRLPFSILGLTSLPQHVTASHRAWIGESRDSSSSQTGNSGDDTLVYIGRHSTRYHRTSGCHYLSNNLTPVPFSAVSAKKNSGGASYHACPRCAKGCSSGTVYIMPSGTAYHTDPDCSAIRAYVRAVPKSSVEHLGACSYCY